MLPSDAASTSSSMDRAPASMVSSILILTQDQMEELGAHGTVVVATGDSALDDIPYDVAGGRHFVVFKRWLSDFAVQNVVN